MTTINADITTLFQRPSFATPLTDEQKSAAEEILSQYDPGSLSDEDAESLRQDLRDAGIRPSRELRSLLEDAGFDAEALRPQDPGGPGGPGNPGGPRGAGGPPPGPPPQEGGTAGEALQTLAEILEDYDTENLTSDNLREIQQRLAEAGFAGNGSVVDQRA